MPTNLADIDPYTPKIGYFECLTCGSRTMSHDRLSTCSSCGGPLQNIAVPRE